MRPELLQKLFHHGRPRKVFLPGECLHPHKATLAAATGRGIDIQARNRNITRAKVNAATAINPYELKDKIGALFRSHQRFAHAFYKLCHLLATVDVHASTLNANDVCAMQRMLKGIVIALVKVLSLQRASCCDRLLRLSRHQRETARKSSRLETIASSSRLIGRNCPEESGMTGRFIFPPYRVPYAEILVPRFAMMGSMRA